MTRCGSYFLSVEQSRFGPARERWASETEQDKRCHPYRRRARVGERGGCLVLVEDGRVARSRPVWSPMGLLADAEGLLVATPWGLDLCQASLDGEPTGWFTHPWCSFLHSVRRTARGVMVASTGLDTVLEVGRSAALMWTWRATERGLDRDPFGRRRSVDWSKDHRGWKYDTWHQSTHVNSALRLHGTGPVLATLFHQGWLVRIQDDGRWEVVLRGLRRPHALRQVGPDTLSLADSKTGRALLLQADWMRAGPEDVRVVTVVDARTRWLQDAYFDGDQWLLVDGAGSRVRTASASGEARAEHQFPGDWRLYEAVPTGRRA